MLAGFHLGGGGGAGGRGDLPPPPPPQRKREGKRKEEEREREGGGGRWVRGGGNIYLDIMIYVHNISLELSNYNIDQYPVNV